MEVDKPGPSKRTKLENGKRVEGLEKANTEITVFTGAMIENEHASEPVGESVGKKEK